MKLTVKEWDQFWKELGEDWYIDDTDFPDDIPKEGIISGDGMLCWQGLGTCSESTTNLFTTEEKTNRGAGFSGVFKRWKKKQTSQSYMVTIPNEKADEFKKLVKSLKGEIASL